VWGAMDGAPTLEVNWGWGLIGDDFNNSANALAVTASGNILMAGRSDSGVSGDKSEPSRGGNDCWLVMLDENGNKLWDKTYGGTALDASGGVLLLPNDEFLIGGLSASVISGAKTSPSIGGMDCWLLILDSSGNLIWQKSYGTTGIDGITNLIATSDGNYMLLAGSGTGLSGDRSEPSRGGSDVWLIKINPSGDIIWEKSFGGSASDTPLNITEVAPDEFLVGCTSQSNATSEKSENSRESEDYWLFKT